MKGLLLFLVGSLWWTPGLLQYIGEEELNPLQETAVIDGATRNLDQIGSTIYTNKTTTTLNCGSGFMNIVVDFQDPFFGIIYPNGSRTSACLTHGAGERQYTINLPLKGCGTSRVDRRVFVNNIIVRFHKGLELEGDEVKTIICRYPSPEVVPPPPFPAPFKTEPIPPGPAKRIGEVEILMIICAIVFLALLLVGMACSYTCLKKRNIRIVRRRPMSLGPPSEISKISGSSLMFDGLKIPRAHATSTSDSDTALVSETLPSDYPSESPSSGSEVEEAEVQHIEEDRLSSVYSDGMVQSEAEMITNQMMLRPPKPTFMVRVKRAPTPPRTPEPDYSVQNALSQSLTTILERDESFRGESLPGSEHAQMLTESEDELHAPPMLLPTPEYAQVQRKTQEVLVETHAPPKHIDMRHVENITRTKQEITDIEEVVERGTRRYMEPRAPSEPDSDYPSEVRSVTDVVEELPMVPRQPTITTHTVDDRYHTTIKETNVTEDVEKHRRFIKQYHMKPKPLPPPKWNVAIRHYPAPKYADENESSGPEWEAYSEPGSDIFRAQMLDGIDDRLSQIEVETMEHPPPPTWRVLLRVLEPPQTDEAVREILTNEDRDKWRQIITTESTLRTMLTTATVREDFERIRRDQRYEKLFEPRKWDVIIRILSPAADPSRPGDETSSEAPSMSDTESLLSIRDGKRYRKYEQHTAVTVGRKSSLPAVYEYDTDGYPVIKRTDQPPSRSRRSSKSSMVSGLDVRSIPETEVNFARLDSCSEASGPSSAGAPRSHADRSHSEITYSVPVLHDEDYPDTDFDDRLSGRTARSLARSASEFTEDWRHHDNMSVSSVGSKPHRQRERSTSEYMEEAPHLSDFQTSPEVSPQMGGRRNRYVTYEMSPYEVDDALTGEEGHFSRSTFVQQSHGEQGTTSFQQSDNSTRFHQQGATSSSSRTYQQQGYHVTETRSGARQEQVVQEEEIKAVKSRKH